MHWRSEGCARPCGRPVCCSGVECSASPSQRYTTAWVSGGNDCRHCHRLTRKLALRMTRRGRWGGVRSRTSRGRSRCRRGWLDLEQLNVELQCRTGLDLRAHLALAIGDCGRTDDARLAANFHQLDGFGPARNHAVERKGRAAAVLRRAVEHVAIGEPAFVSHFYFIGTLGTGACAFLDRYVDEAAGGLFRS